MQSRYVGDIGDYAKYSLLRAVSPGYRLGVAWYLYPDEGHNNDGKHVGYLDQPNKWRHRDPETFDALHELVTQNKRSVSALENSGILPATAFSNMTLDTRSSPSSLERSEWRRAWFEQACRDLDECDLVFADPDNGLAHDDTFRMSGRSKSWKGIPESEARKLADGRTAIIYHHNSRRKGGHEEEVKYWQNRIGSSFALRIRFYSARTYFFVNATDDIFARAADWAAGFADGTDKIVLHHA